LNGMKSPYGWNKQRAVNCPRIVFDRMFRKGI
jgi:hypothetical protein